MVAVSVESANRYLLPESLQLSLDLTVISTAVHFDAEAAVFPERSLAAEAVRCLHQRDQQRHSDWTDRRNLAEQLRRWMLLTFGEQLAASKNMCVNLGYDDGGFLPARTNFDSKKLL